jgi:hypothetical protein
MALAFDRFEYDGNVTATNDEDLGAFLAVRGT